LKSFNPASSPPLVAVAAGSQPITVLELDEGGLDKNESAKAGKSDEDGVGGSNKW